MHSLKDKLYQTTDFLVGVEMVSVRGSMAEKSAQKARSFSNELINYPEVDWVSITDNAGGNPQMAPLALGRPILYAGKEVVIHLTCKDLNRNGLESEAWLLNSEGFNNILAMTGDYPIAGNEGIAKPVFDIDSVGLISMLNKMNQGFYFSSKGKPGSTQRLSKTNFLIGAVTTNFKLKEGEVMPQYLKLEKKVSCGAQFIINQVGYDSRKIHELRLYMDHHKMRSTPLIGNVYLLNPRVAQLFHDQRIPGVVVSPELLQVCLMQQQSKDQGKQFFLEFAARQAAIYRGLGYRGIYIGGVSNVETVRKIIEIERSYSRDDWKTFAQKISYSRPQEYFFYQKDPESKLADGGKTTKAKPLKSKHLKASYFFSKWVHRVMFDPDSYLAKKGMAACSKAKDPKQGPKLLRAVEKLSKSAMFDCNDCGDCSLPDIEFLCPESYCAKNQRNGPCGGTRDGECEVDGIGDCMWLRAYERRKHRGEEQDLLSHSPMVQNQGLRYTSAWANHWLGRDHSGKSPKAFQPVQQTNTPSTPKSTGSDEEKSQPKPKQTL